MPANPKKTGAENTHVEAAAEPALEPITDAAPESGDAAGDDSNADAAGDPAPAAGNSPASASRARGAQPASLVNLISHNTGRPVLMERNALENWGHRIQTADARAFERPGRVDALVRKLSQPLVMEDDDYTPEPPLEQALAYSPRYIGDPDDTGFCWSLKSGVALMCADTPLLDEGVQICGVNFHGYDTLLGGMKEAAEDPRVKAIFLKLDSPGGIASGGIVSLAKWMRANRASAGGKPIWVYAKMACSAAQWIAAQSDFIAAPELAYVGSVGCYQIHEDWSAAYAHAGLKVTEFAMWENKTDGAEWKEMSASASVDAMARVEQVVKMFAADMTAGRPGLTFDKLKDMRSRAFYSRHDDPAQSGLALGLVDAIMSEEEAFIALLAKVSGAAAAGSVKPSGGTQPGSDAPPGDGGPSDDPAPQVGQAATPSHASGAQIVNLDSVRESVRGESAAHHVEIVELCALAEQPQLAAEFIRAGRSIEQVREELQMRRVETSNARKISGHITSEAGDNKTHLIEAGWEKSIRAARGKLKGE